GMKPARPLDRNLTLIRPLLSISRLEIVRYLTELGQQWHDDPTNADPDFTRNRIRHELLPLLDRDYNPRVRNALAKLARQADEAQEIIEAAASDLLRQAVLDRTSGSARIDVRPLENLPRHLVRECFARL